MYTYCRYSLRSLEKNAPWIRHIFIVTNGQVPTWLDTSNPKVSIVTHKEIFKNPKVLPTFSSPSIEMNLHHIRGLSDYFIYFNDDVFLGSPVTPSDFISLEQGQMLYASWEVPECSEYCAYTSLGNGFCDARCNNPACAYDFGDCENIQPITQPISRQEEVLKLAQVEEECNEQCPREWIADGVCHEECNRPECGFDGGDCRELTEHHYNLSFRCHFDADVNVTSPVFSSKEIKEADYYIENEYVMEPESYCLARVVVEPSPYVILQLDPAITSLLSIESIECLETGRFCFVCSLVDVVLSSRYDGMNHTVFVLIKPSLVSYPFTLHFLALGEVCVTHGFHL